LSRIGCWLRAMYLMSTYYRTRDDMTVEYITEAFTRHKINWVLLMLGSDAQLLADR
jgi:hypothetical protein